MNDSGGHRNPCSFSCCLASCSEQRRQKKPVRFFFIWRHLFPFSFLSWSFFFSINTTKWTPEDVYRYQFIFPQMQTLTLAICRMLLCCSFLHILKAPEKMNGMVLPYFLQLGEVKSSWFLPQKGIQTYFWRSKIYQAPHGVLKIKSDKLELFWETCSQHPGHHLIPLCTPLHSRILLHKRVVP